MAFMIGPLEETDVWTLQDKEKVDILFALRDDQESRYLNKRNVESIGTILKNNSYTSHLSFELVDWWDREKFFNASVESPIGPDFQYKVKGELNKHFDHMKNFRSSIALMSVGKVLITDRLHTSILAFLLHKPHVYLDQSYGKITRTREVAFSTSIHCQDKVKMRYDSAETLEEAVILANNMLLNL